MKKAANPYELTALTDQNSNAIIADNINLCSGLGQYHSDGGSKPKQLNTITLNDVKAMLATPQQVDKSNAQWVIFSDLVTRNGDAQKAKGKFYAFWFDIDEPAGKDLQSMAKDLSNALNGCELLAYTSRSATADNQKARLIIPLAVPITAQEFINVATIINDKLESLGISPDRAAQRPNQICYLPNRGEYYDNLIIEGTPLDCLAVLASELSALQLQQQAVKEAQQAQQVNSLAMAQKRVESGTASPIDAFNACYSVEQTMLQYGYSKEANNRYLSPISESGIAGVTIKDNRWISSHGSDVAAGLGRTNTNGCSGDSFDLYSYFEHGNNRNKALKALGELFTVATGTSITKANQQAYMKQHEQDNEHVVIGSNFFIKPLSVIDKVTACDSDGVISCENEPNILPIAEAFEANHLVLATDSKAIYWRLMATHARVFLKLVTDEEFAQINETAIESKTLVIFMGDVSSTTRLNSHESQYVKLATIDINALNNQGNRSLIKLLIASIAPYFKEHKIKKSPRFWDYNYDRDGNETTPQETLKNFTVLLNWEGIILRYKVIGRDIEWRDPYQCTGDTADSDRLTSLFSAAKKYRLPTTLITDYIQKIASTNQFNPVLSFINRTQWDQETDYIEQLLNTITLAAGFDISLARLYLTKWLISAVMLAAMDRPQEAHGVFILQSDNHGAGKGRWFKRLVADIDPSLLGNGGLDVRDKDSILRIGKKWIYELSEIEASMNRREIGELKAFITTDVDEVRAPYARTAQKLPRRTVFCGSANVKQFLTDPSGSRRFWVIPITAANHEHPVNIQQVWAQAYHLFKSGESWYLNSAETQAVTQSNDDHFQALCPIAEKLSSAFLWDTPSHTWFYFMTATDALGFCFDDLYRPTPKDLNLAGSFLRKRCGDKLSKKVKGVTLRGFNMPERITAFSC